MVETLPKLKFSGHESFHCRQFWLKKGFDHVQENKSFNEEAVLDLGVGKNMVGSIRFWLRAFDIVNEESEINEWANHIFKDDGWDPYMEDEATLWLLHYKLCQNNYSSIYNFIFTELRKVRPEFSKQHFILKVLEKDSGQSVNSLEKDFTVFTRSYFAKPSKDKEESFSGLFSELELLKEDGEDNQNNQLYHISNRRESSIPWQLVLYCILENDEFGDSISMKNLTSSNGLASIFAFSLDDLENKLIEIGSNIKGIVYKNDAGVKELQFKNGKPKAIEILKAYYEK